MWYNLRLRPIYSDSYKKQKMGILAHALLYSGISCVGNMIKIFSDNKLEFLG